MEFVTVGQYAGKLRVEQAIKSPCGDRLEVTRVETLNIEQIATAKFRSVREESHHLAFRRNCSTISHMC